MDLFRHLHERIAGRLFFFVVTHIRSLCLVRDSSNEGYGHGAVLGDGS